MVRRVIHETGSGGSGGFGIVGVIIGALIVIGAIFFFAGGPDMFARNGTGASSSGPSVTVNTPAAPSAPSTSSAPSAPRAPAPTTGSGTTR
jgi:hypothetical protein